MAQSRWRQNRRSYYAEGGPPRWNASCERKIFRLDAGTPADGADDTAATGEQWKEYQADSLEGGVGDQTSSFRHLFVLRANHLEAIATPAERDR